MGYLQVLLNLVAFVNLVLDGFCLILSWDMIIVYLFAFGFVGSLLVMCVVITAVQERNPEMLAYTKLWTMMKLIILIAMTLIAVSGLLDLYFSDPEQFQISPEQKLLLPIAIASIVFLGLQNILTKANVPEIAKMPKLFSESRMSMDV
ncbi:hypothetical protein L596_029990 [Steinernema carpocapsae]|uniref:7TM GPCR serpentine receptor class x (Srx) domain-containing protein n=1 Tax=Steinernema carpocapsae TaxID=34508 RepID=A0A4U5LRE7_STECR|nr:hypothetical protein L596_029990 [Steinernema carpocapsae]